MIYMRGWGWMDGGVQPRSVPVKTHGCGGVVDRERVWHDSIVAMPNGRKARCSILPLIFGETVSGRKEAGTSSERARSHKPRRAGDRRTRPPPPCVVAGLPPPPSPCPKKPCPNPRLEICLWMEGYGWSYQHPSVCPVRGFFF